MSKYLSIMEIERFAIHDGPGIRTTVFLQGCPLHCRWCANPESHKIGVHLMYLSNKCIGCGACYEACNYSAISFVNNRPVFHREKCVACKECERVCLQDAIHFSGEMLSIEQIMEVILRDKDYYVNSGGGVTVSGGEAFVQFEGLMELLKQCREQGIHTAIETCGQYSVEKLKQALPLLDLVLFDLKHTDPEKLFEYTGGNLEQILGNIKYIASVDPGRIIIRVPVIPHFNFDLQSIEKILDTVKELGILEVHLLPYHTLGINKYEQLGRKYELKAKKSLLKKDLEPYRLLGESKGLTVKVGG